MKTDPKTIAVYDDKASDYAKMVDDLDEAPGLAAFAAALPEPAHVLGFGCGPGMDAASLAKRGFQVDALDASREMVKLANGYEGVNATQGTFDDLDAVDCYDGIWANFSLLHAGRSDFPRYLLEIATALKPGGVLSIGLKLGRGEKRDSIGRLYTYYGEDELIALLADAGFTPLDRVKGATKGLDGVVADWIVVLARG